MDPKSIMSSPKKREQELVGQDLKFLSKIPKLCDDPDPSEFLVSRLSLDPPLLSKKRTDEVCWTV